jgi:hypothetical protein
MHRREWRDDRKTLVKNGFRTHFLTSQPYSARVEVAVISTATTAKKRERSILVPATIRRHFTLGSFKLKGGAGHLHDPLERGR